MKILVVTSTFPRWPGDTDPTFVYELSKRLIDSDTEVHILAPHACHTKTQEVLDGLSVHRFRYFFERWETLAYGGGMLDKLRANPFNYLLIPCLMVGMALAVRNLHKRHNFDVVHAHWLIPQGFACACALLFMSKPPELVCTSHGGDLFGLRGSIPSKLKKWVLEKSHTVTVVSNYMRDFVTANLEPTQTPLVASMGVDLVHRFIPQPDVARQSNTIIYVGRLAEKKGVAYLLEATSLIYRSFPELRLFIVGGGPLRDKLERQSIELGIEASITFVGPVTQDELPRLYSSAAIAVVPSIVAASGDQEGLGLVTVEAMGCGCAVIASDLAAIRDVVKHDENGLLVAPGNPQKIADSLTMLLTNESRLHQLQTSARDSVVTKFDWEIIAEKYRILLKAAAH